MTTPNDPAVPGPVPGQKENPDDPGAAFEPDPPGVRRQFGATLEAGKRLIRAHIDLGKAEAGEIMGEVGRVAMYAGAAFGLLFLAGILVPVGLMLFLGEWIFGSIGWGVLLGSLLLIDGAVGLVLVAIGIGGGRLARAGFVALLIGVVVGVILGLDLSNRAWAAVGDSLLPTVDAGVRPLAAAALVLAIVGAVVGLVAGLRGGSGGGAAFGGLVAGAIVGALLGVLTAIALGPRVGAAFGVLAWLIAWLVLAGLDVAREGIDTDALKARFYPSQTIETTKETIEWVREQTPLGRKS